ncbi:MAG: hypothetical protein ACLUGJ_19625 [Blautia wexlerae]
MENIFLISDSLFFSGTIVTEGYRHNKTKLRLCLKTTLEQLQLINDVAPGWLSTSRFNSLIFELMFQLYHNFSRSGILPQQSPVRKKEYGPVWNLYLNYIAQHYREPISLNEIADSRLSPDRIFLLASSGKNVDVTFLEYQNEYRLSFIYRRSDHNQRSCTCHSVLQFGAAWLYQLQTISQDVP